MDLIPVFVLQKSRSSISISKHHSEVFKSWAECKGRKWFKKALRCLEVQTTYRCLGVPGQDASTGGGAGQAQVLQKGGNREWYICIPKFTFYS